jgi:hypothetical protein
MKLQKAAEVVADAPAERRVTRNRLNQRVRIDEELTTRPQQSLTICIISSAPSRLILPMSFIRVSAVAPRSVLSGSPGRLYSVSYQSSRFRYFSGKSSLLGAVFPFARSGWKSSPSRKSRLRAVAERVSMRYFAGLGGLDAAQ